MKTALSFFMTLVMMISLTACSGQSSTSSANPSPPVSEPPTSSDMSASEEAVSQKAESPNSAQQTAASESDAPDTEDTMRVLVAYFSATGTTKALAEDVAEITGGDLYEIVPEAPYTSDDLNYNDSNSRTTKEQNDDTARPTISGSVDDMAQYDVIFLGYPIWNGTAPKIMSTFVESYDLSGKTIVPFCTSGGSGIGSSAQNLHALVSGDVIWLDGQRFSGNADQTAVRQWVDALELGLTPAA